jgi:dTDP-4-dehydrorhamnose reductase
MPKLNYCTEDWKRLFAPAGIAESTGGPAYGCGDTCRDPAEYFHVNAELTKQLVSACSASQHFIYVSTICAHPDGGAYGRSKWLAEEAIRGSRLDYTIIRPSEIYGSKDGEGIDALIAVARKVRILPDFRYGGSIKYAPISTQEAAHFIAEATIYRRQKGQTYTLCADRLCTAPEMARALRSSVRPLFVIPGADHDASCSEGASITYAIQARSNRSTRSTKSVRQHAGTPRLRFSAQSFIDYLTGSGKIMARAGPGR